MKSEFSTKTLIYLRAADLVEQGHCKHWLAKNENGCPELPESDYAVSFCITGSVFRAAKELGLSRNDVPSPEHLIEWNNRPATTAAMVAAKLREQAFT